MHSIMYNGFAYTPLAISKRFAINLQDTNYCLDNNRIPQIRQWFICSVVSRRKTLRAAPTFNLSRWFGAAFAFRPMTKAWYWLGFLKKKVAHKIANQQLHSLNNAPFLSGGEKPQFLWTLFIACHLSIKVMDALTLFWLMKEMTAAPATQMPWQTNYVLYGRFYTFIQSFNLHVSWIRLKKEPIKEIDNILNSLKTTFYLK